MALPNFNNVDLLRSSSDILSRFGINIFGGIDNIRNLEWGKKYLWEVTFLDPKPPAPFTDFFPATDIDIIQAPIESFIFDQGQSTFKAPQKSNIRQLTMTFFDTQEAVLANWMSDWMEIDILNDGHYVSCLLDSHPHEGTRKIRFESDERVWPTRTVKFARLDNMLEPVKGTEQTLTIYPEGELTFSGSSGSEANVFTMNFVIVGENKTASNKSKNSIVEKATKEATRLVGRFV